jgi:hypothetical protein
MLIFNVQSGKYFVCNEWISLYYTSVKFVKSLALPFKNRFVFRAGRGAYSYCWFPVWSLFNRFHPRREWQLQFVHRLHKSVDFHNTNNVDCRACNNTVPTQCAADHRRERWRLELGIHSISSHLSARWPTRLNAHCGRLAVLTARCLESIVLVKFRDWKWRCGWKVKFASPDIYWSQIALVLRGTSVSSMKNQYLDIKYIRNDEEAIKYLRVTESLWKNMCS